MNNNAYTNLMARENLRTPPRPSRPCAPHPDVYNALAHTTALQPSEVEAWQRAAAHMYVPYDAQTGITLRMTAFWTASLGLPARRPTATRCCCFIIRLTSTASK